MTAYVVYGLLTAQANGFAVNKEILDNGLAAVGRQVRKPLGAKVDATDRAFALYTLSLAGRDKEAGTGLATLLNRKLDSDELALTAMTAANVGHPAVATDCMSRLWSKATTDGEMIYWKNDADLYYYMPETETTALALMAAVKLTPDDPRIPGVIRWLLSRRNLNHWVSTRDTAFILYALSDYLKRSNELQPNFTATVWHNGDKISQLKFDTKNFLQPERQLVMRPRGKVSGEDTIRIETSGPGRLYYTIETVQYVDRKLPPRTPGQVKGIRVMAGILQTRPQTTRYRLQGAGQPYDELPHRGYDTRASYHRLTEGITAACLSRTTSPQAVKLSTADGWATTSGTTGMSTRM